MLLQIEWFSFIFSSLNHAQIANIQQQSININVIIKYKNGSRDIFDKSEIKPSSVESMEIDCVGSTVGEIEIILNWRADYQ